MNTVFLYVHILQHISVHRMDLTHETLVVFNFLKFVNIQSRFATCHSNLALEPELLFYLCRAFFFTSSVFHKQ